MLQVLGPPLRGWKVELDFTKRERVEATYIMLLLDDSSRSTFIIDSIRPDNWCRTRASLPSLAPSSLDTPSILLHADSSYRPTIYQGNPAIHSSRSRRH